MEPQQQPIHQQQPIQVVMIKPKMEMVAALNLVKCPDHFKQKFFPLILKYAGSKMKVSDIAWALVSAAEEYLAGLDSSMRRTVYTYLRPIADAIIADQKLAMEVRSLL